MDRLFATLGAVSALLAVAAGAFGAHALRSRLSADLLAAFETGARGFGAATPVGGLAFLAGWLALTVGIWRSST